MRPKWGHALILLAIAGCLPGQQPKSQLKPPTTAGGVFLGKSGKPMAGARLILCNVLEDQGFFRGKVILLPNVPTATVDKTGRFEFRGFAPGGHTILYLPASVDVVVPNEISVWSLNAVDKSSAPLLRNFELGPFNVARPWGQFTLLKGHTFWSMGPQMKIYNATVRRGQQGPFLEIRRGILWMQEIADKTEIKFDAWSF